MARIYLSVALISINYILTNYADEASDQLIDYRNKTNGLPRPILTSSNGAPISYQFTKSSLNSNIIRNRYLTESLMHLTRERIPERVVHSKGAGAFGYFEVTNDLSHLSEALLFGPVGERTPVAVRFSLTFSHLGSADTTRGSKGLAIKFYTEEGNFDMPGLHTPMFPLKDPVLLPTFFHAIHNNPVTNLGDLNAFWDFIVNVPESMNAFLRLFSDYGTPKGYQYMPGYSIHTYELVNHCGEQNFVRFHVLPEEGIQNFNASQASKLMGSDPDYYTRILYNAIAEGNYPAWLVKLQILSLDDVQNAKIDVFDTSKELPVADYPLHDFGRLVLDRNQDNFFAEVEQLAFCPSNLVPGILGAPDKLFESRMLSYRDAQNYRLGSNHDKIQVNYPYRSKVATYNRYGSPPTMDDGLDGPNYYPNSFNGPVPYIEHNSESEILEIIEDKANNFDQANDFYSNQLTSEERTSMVNGIVGRLKGGAKFLQEKVLDIFYKINTELADRVKAGLAAPAPVQS